MKGHKNTVREFEQQWLNEGIANELDKGELEQLRSDLYEIIDNWKGTEADQLFDIVSPIDRIITRVEKALKEVF